MAPDTAEAKIQEIAAKFDEGKYRESDAALKAIREHRTLQREVMDAAIVDRFAEILTALRAA